MQTVVLYQKPQPFLAKQPFNAQQSFPSPVFANKGAHLLDQATSAAGSVQQKPSYPQSQPSRVGRSSKGRGRGRGRGPQQSNWPRT